MASITPSSPSSPSLTRRASLVLPKRFPNLPKVSISKPSCPTSDDIKILNHYRRIITTNIPRRDINQQFKDNYQSLDIILYLLVQTIDFIQKDSKSSLDYQKILGMVEENIFRSTHLNCTSGDKVFKYAMVKKVGLHDFLVSVRSSNKHDHPSLLNQIWTARIHKVVEIYNQLIRFLQYKTNQ